MWSKSDDNRWNLGLEPELGEGAPASPAPAQAVELEFSLHYANEIENAPAGVEAAGVEAAGVEAAGVEAEDGESRRRQLVERPSIDTSNESTVYIYIYTVQSGRGPRD